MKWNLKKMWPAAAASLVVFTSLVNAADDSQMRNLENRVTALEQRRGSNGMINPPANPRVKEAADIFITGEVTYMKARENGLEYAFLSRDGNTRVINGEAQSPRHEYEWGFKVGLGYVAPHDGWDLYANYWRFNGHEHNCKPCENECGCVCPSELFFPTFLIPCFDSDCPDVTKACGKWKLRVNVLDLELGREFFVSKWLTFRPFMGLRGAIITQHLNIEYAGGSYVPSGHEFEHKMRDQFRGGGLRGGFDTQWDFAKDWSLYGEVALNVLLGKFEIDQFIWDETESATESAETRTSLGQFEDHYLVCRPVADLRLGLQWEHAFADDSFYMNIHAGWEHHYFWGQNQFLKFINEESSAAFVSNQGDLSISGWVLGARFDF